MTTTTNLGLKKPESSDPIDVSVLNDNADAIDNYAGRVNDALAGISDVNDSTITIQKNGTTVDSFTTNQASDKTINITVPTSAADVSALPESTKYGASIIVSIDNATYVMTTTLKDQDGNTLGTAQIIDLPLETMVVGGSYDSANKKVVLTLKNGQTVEFSVADLVNGLQTEFSASNKLNPAYINYDSAHRAVTDTEKTVWNGKQDTLTFDSAPTADSANPVTSGGVKTDQNRQDALEAQDRAALVELVDGSAKNVLVNTAQYGELVRTNITFTHNSDDTYSVNAENSNTANTDLYVAENISLEPGDYILTGCPAGGNNNSTYKLQIAGIGYDTENGFSFTIAQTTTISVYIRIWAGYVPNGLVFKPMICTKAAWDISQKYVPYRPTYDELVSRIEALENT